MSAGVHDPVDPEHPLCLQVVWIEQMAEPENVVGGNNVHRV